MSNTQQSVCAPSRVPRWKLNRADWDKFQTICDLTTIDINETNIDTLTNSITAAILSAAEQSIPKTSGRFPIVPKPWWTNDCKIARKQQNSAWGIFRRYPTTENLLKFKKAKAYARYIRRQSQRNCWRNYVSTITCQSNTKTVYDKIKKMKGRYTDRSRSILISNNEEISSVEKQVEIFGKSFAKIYSDDNCSNEFLTIKRNAEKKSLNFNSLNPEPYNCCLTFPELQIALKKSKNSAVGPDNIHYEMIKHLSDNSLHFILNLFNRIWSEHVFPRSWKHAIIIPIPKPGKDKSNAENYRPIALTSCLGKLFERIVNARLFWYLESNNLLSQSQCGFRKQRCTIDQLIRLETEIRNAYVNRQHLVSVFFDLEKAYDKTWRFGILRDLHTYGLRGNLAYVIQNFLLYRTFQVRIGSTTSHKYVQETGVPQGSVLSATLFLVKINSISNCLPPTIQHCLYADDLQISCHSVNLRLAVRTLQRAIQHLCEWALNNGYTFSPSKTVCVDFNRKRGLHPPPELYLGRNQIQVATEHRFLGLILDNKLTFRPHLVNLRTKCSRDLNIIKMLSNTHWGADKVALLRIYRSLIRPKIDYGSIIYDSSCISVKKIIDPIHHQAIRLCLGAFPTSPIKSLLAESFEPPLCYRRMNLSIRYYLKILSLPNHPAYSAVTTRKYEQLYSNKPSVVQPFCYRISSYVQNTTLENVNIERTSDNLIPPWSSSVPECNINLTKYNKSNTCNTIFQKLYSEQANQCNSFQHFYTDGSKEGQFVGSAFVTDELTHAVRLPSLCSIYTAELYAIFMALEYIWFRDIQAAIIYTDSLSSIQSIQNKPSYNHPIVHKIWEILDKLQTNVVVKLFWIPSHVGIKGNDLADHAAKGAISQNPITIHIPYSDALTHIFPIIYSLWQDDWKCQINNKLYTVSPVLKHLLQSSFKSRREDVIMSRLRIGHTKISHAHLLEGLPAPICPQCNSVLSVLHILLQCPKYSLQREKHFADLFKFHVPLHISLLLNNSDLLNPKSVIEFLKEINLINLI